MTYNERLAIAAHLHVLIRRITGRVTDVEWMAVNDEYALHIKDYSVQKAAETDRPDLVEWADKLAIEIKAGAAPSISQGSALAGEDAPQPGTDQAAGTQMLRRRAEKHQKYVGGLRM